MPNPKQTRRLMENIQFFKGDVSSILFHFTRRIGKLTAFERLKKILSEEKLDGSNTYTDQQIDKCICFTESPIQHFNAIFALNEIEQNEKDKARYEPYGIAISKKSLYAKGGRPVIYDSNEVLKILHNDLKYRFVEFDYSKREDVTWEREWRIKTDELTLLPEETIVVVPTVEEAYELSQELTIDGYSVSCDGEEAYIDSVSPIPKWFVTSLDIFGFKFH